MPEKFSIDTIEETEEKDMAVETPVKTNEKPVGTENEYRVLSDPPEQVILRAQRLAEQKKEENRSAIAKAFSKIGDYFAKLDEEAKYGVNHGKTNTPKGRSELGNRPSDVGN